MPHWRGSPQSSKRSSSLYLSLTRNYESQTSGGSSQVTTYSAYNLAFATADGNQFGGSSGFTNDMGWTVAQTNVDSNGVPQSGVVYDAAGNQYPFGNWATGGCVTTKENDLQGAMSTTVCNSSTSTTSAIDANGNTYLIGSNGVDVDTLGRNISFGQTFGNQTTDYSDCVSSLPIYSAVLFSYPAANGVNNQLKICYSGASYHTAFGAPGIAEASNGAAGLPVTIILPDHSKWTFTYDSDLGVTSIGLPLGDSISYQ